MYSFITTISIDLLSGKTRVILAYTENTRPKTNGDCQFNILNNLSIYGNFTHTLTCNQTRYCLAYIGEITLYISMLQPYNVTYRLSIMRERYKSNFMY